MNWFFTRTTKTLTWIGCVLATACSGNDALPPQGQVLLYLDTDAPLRSEPVDDTSTASVGLFDRLRLEVFQGDPSDLGAPKTQRDFSLHQGLFADGPISVGIVPDPGDDQLFAHIRLFRADRVRLATPPVGATIDRWVHLPSVKAEGIVEAFVMLRTEDVGVAGDPQDAEEPDPVIPETSLVDTWPYGNPIPCEADAHPEETCVPGGAFFMGDPALQGNPELDDSNEERLIAVSPFFLDRYEVTVEEFRKVWTDLKNSKLEPPLSWDENATPDDPAYFATYVDKPADQDVHPDELPINGITWETARAYCLAQGKDLPTSAMYEYVASGRGTETNYVWGNDEPTCDSAVVSRAGVGYFAGFEGECRPLTSAGGPLLGGNSVDDRISVAPPGDESDATTIVDLAGNVSEWMLDTYAMEGEGIWAEPGLLTDPGIPEGSSGNAVHPVRGGSWLSPFVNLRSAAKRGVRGDKPDLSTGFRCARH